MPDATVCRPPMKAAATARFAIFRRREPLRFSTGIAA
jgi:hypothetical protein